MHFAVFKEPRGMIKILQFGLTIFAFATTCGVFTQSKFTVTCLKQNNKTHDFTVKIWYPFNLGMDENAINYPICNKTGKVGRTFPSGNYQSASQFYVFIGVMAWLYSIGGAVLYVVFNENYENNDKIRIGDFIVTGVFVVMWLIASAAWADNLSSMKHFSNPLIDLIPHISDCQAMPRIASCLPGSQGDFATLNVSIIFGFGNMVLFGASLWFLWKETPWHRSREESFTPDQSPEQPAPGPGPDTYPTPQPTDAQY